ncbi:MAG: LytTR family DNA-binding domain-containing protein [Defluviitaleaceae bacterium]|nr:LytTR family DNA-binding domain-containing protein [Defluviitaleaceae bacterium]
MRIIICDDEATQIDNLRGLLGIWANSRGVSLQVDAFNSAEQFLFAYEDDKSVDMLLLDVQMGEMDGVTLAKAVRKTDKAVQIIFITGYMDYILDGYDVEALHYLLKPVSQEKLFIILDKAAEKLAHNEKALFVTHMGESIRVPLYEIRYLEVMHNYVTIHAGAAYTIKKPLKELEEQLDDNFFRAGRSYIVNLKYIRRTSKTEIHLSCGAVVPLSRGLYGPLNQAIIKMV